MKNLIKFVVASALVLGFNAFASNSGSSVFGGSLNYHNNVMATGSGSSVFGG